MLRIKVLFLIIINFENINKINLLEEINWVMGGKYRERQYHN